mmetsp:Transcript_4287/g.7992  ORF Transcript_4287/g.7992 Transcript_4287/m.7992 type:complete len:93 (+) Transcript_4287:337-615(+)
MKSAIAIITLLAAAISSNRVAADLDRIDRYNWVASENDNEWGRNRANRGIRRNLRANRKLRVLTEASMSLSMPEIEEFNFDLEASMSMSMSL